MCVRERWREREREREMEREKERQREMSIMWFVESCSLPSLKQLSGDVLSGFNIVGAAMQHGLKSRIVRPPAAFRVAALDQGDRVFEWS